MSLPQRKLLIRIGLVTLSATLAFCATEAVVRRSFCRELGLDSFSEVRQRYLGNPASVYSMFEGRVRGLEPGTSDRRATINSLGFRGPEISREKGPDVTRIVCLGGSSVYGTTSSRDGTTWPGWLSKIASRDELQAPVEVLNGGVSGFTAVSSFARFMDVFLPLDVDLAVLSSIHNGFVGNRVRNLQIDSTQEEPTIGEAWLDRLLSHSAVYVRIRANLAYSRKKERYRERNARAQQEADVSPKHPDGLRQTWLDHRVGNREERFAIEARASEGVNPYLVPEDLAAFRGVMKRFIEVARDNDVVPVLCTQALGFPLDPDAGGYPMHSLLELLFPDYRDFCGAFAAYNDCLRQLAEDEAVPLFDADALMPRNRTTFHDHVHYTDNGCRVYAQLLWDFLLEAGLLPTRQTP